MNLYVLLLLLFVTYKALGVANVVKRDLVSPGSLLYNSNYAMDAYVQRHRRKCHSMRLRRTMSYASLTHVEITSVTHVEARQ